jgi:hypothetical protein
MVILHLAGLASHRRRPLSSNVRPHRPTFGGLRNATNTNHVAALPSLILYAHSLTIPSNPPPQRMRPFILIACLLLSLPTAAQLPHPEEVRFLTEYAQYSLRTELTVTKVNAATNGY